LFPSQSSQSSIDPFVSVKEVLACIRIAELEVYGSSPLFWLVWLSCWRGKCPGGEPELTSQSQAEDCRFRARGENPYFALKLGYQLVLEGEEDGETIGLEITVREKTETIDIPDIGKVRTRVVKEVETTDGELTESNPLEPDAGREKTYCPGIGLAVDDVVQLVEYGSVEDDDNDQ
jgi:hypothetical protein